MSKMSCPPDKKMLLHKSSFLVYAGARFPRDPVDPSLEDFQVVFSLFGLASGTPLEILNQAKAIISRGDISGDGRIH